MIICVYRAPANVTHHEVVAIIAEHPKVPASMVGSITIHVVQQERYSVIHHSPLTEVAIVTLLFQDGVGYYSFLQVAHRILWIGTL